MTKTMGSSVRQRRASKKKPRATSTVAGDPLVPVAPEPESEAPATPRVIAFYLPQFHPIPENDAWWEPGFTEWTKVGRAGPLFDGHAQPRLPSELGYYDLRVPEVRRKQAEMAKEYGIDGFCYYYYWFNGHRLLERPLNDMLADPDTDIPFCVCWANETWSRRWDGSDAEILIEQTYSKESLEHIFDDMSALFNDDRYIKVNGRPLVLVYRAGDISAELSLPNIWRERARQLGLIEPYLCAALTFGLKDPRLSGYDSAVEFPPHTVNATEIEPEKVGATKFAGKIYDYAETVANELRKGRPTFPCHRCAMTGWDNTPRRGANGHLFLNSTPELYELWLRTIINEAKMAPRAQEQLVFINAWNEWAEGTYLEPDRLNGRAYLEATKRAKAGTPSASIAASALELRLGQNDAAAASWLTVLKTTIASQERAIAALVNISRERVSPHELFEPSLALPQTPIELDRPVTVVGGVFNFDRLGTARRGREVVQLRQETLAVMGWHFVKGVPRDLLSELFLVFSDAETKQRHFAPINTRMDRSDVDVHFSSLPPPEIRLSGFAGNVDVSLLPASRYNIALACASEDIAYYAPVGSPILVT